MKRTDQDRLLQDVLADDALARLRVASLAGGLASLRQRRRRQRLLATASTLAFVLAVLLVAQRRPAAPPLPAVVEAKNPPIKFITDEQLFALFPDRATALIGPPGEQKFIFLDAPATPSVEEKKR